MILFSVCLAGRFGSSCEMCPLGTYKSVMGNQACTSCGAVLITNSVGSTAASQCGKLNKDKRAFLCSFVSNQHMVNHTGLRSKVLQFTILYKVLLFTALYSVKHGSLQWFTM